MTEQDRTLSLSEFARYKGWRPSYVTELKLAGRLVLADDGRVRVRESLARIEATQDPSKTGVAARHAAERAAKAATDNAGTAGDAGDDAVAPFAPPAAALHARSDAGDDEAGGSRYQRARALNEQYKAAQAKLDYEERIGKLVDAQQVRAAGAELGTTVRRHLERLPTLLSAQVDERDRDRIFTTVTDQLEQLLSDLERVTSRATARKEPA